MRARHTPHTLPAFPIYSSAFLSETELVLGGGGGATRSGIKNKLRYYTVDDAHALTLVDEFELAKGEDAPMSMCAEPTSKQLVCGINSTDEKVKAGQNENCRVFGVRENKLTAIDSRGTLNAKDVEEDYQKATVLSPNKMLVAVGGHLDFSLLQFPSLSPAAPALRIPGGEIYDASFSPDSRLLAVATTVNLLVYAVPALPSGKKTKGKGKEKAGDMRLLHKLEPPGLPGGSSGTFRGVKFHPTDDKILYAAINNSPPPRTRKTKTVARQAYVCKYRWTPTDATDETDSTKEKGKWECGSPRKIVDKWVTCFEVSPNGTFLAYGSADCTIGLLDATKLGPLLTILKAHDFPPTTLQFSPGSKLLVSGSADNSVRLVTLPDGRGSSSWAMIVMVLITLLVILIAIGVQQVMKR